MIFVRNIRDSIPVSDTIKVQAREVRLSRHYTLGCYQQFFSYQSRQAEQGERQQQPIQPEDKVDWLVLFPKKPISRANATCSAFSVLSSVSDLICSNPPRTPFVICGTHICRTYRRLVECLGLLQNGRLVDAILEAKPGKPLPPAFQG